MEGLILIRLIVFIFTMILENKKLINVQGKEFNVESHKFYNIPLQESLN